MTYRVRTGSSSHDNSKTAHKLLVYYMDNIVLRVNIVYNIGSERPATLMQIRTHRRALPLGAVIASH